MDKKGYGSKTSSENNFYKLLKDSTTNVQDLKKERPAKSKK